MLACRCEFASATCQLTIFFFSGSWHQNIEYLPPKEIVTKIVFVSKLKDQLTRLFLVVQCLTVARGGAN
jgi:hypothetical protein